MMVSYAQDAEDVLLQRVFPRDYQGFYIDAGASDPVQLSVTKHFYDHGWRGVNIEPVPPVWARLRDQRPRDINLNMGLSDRVGRFTLYEVESESSWSTFSESVADSLRARGIEVRPREIPVTTLAQVCEMHADAPIDILKIDVEGYELEVVKGGDWIRWRPRVVLLENNGAEDWHPILLGHGYVHANTTEINRFYVRKEDRDLLPRFAAPLGYQDSFILAAELGAVGRMFAPDEKVHEVAEATQMHSATLCPHALRLHRLASRHPRLAAVGKSLLRVCHRALQNQPLMGASKPASPCG